MDPVSRWQSNLDDPRIVAAAQEYLALLESGDSPSREAFVARYPDIAAELAACLEGLDLLHQGGPTAPKHPFESSTAVSETLQPLGDFRLIREIGRGGMGVVYEAKQLSLGRRVAVKVLPFAAALDSRHLQRFKNEAQAAAQLHHTNIVPVYAVGIERGVHFYAMQLIDGEPLSRLIAHLRSAAGKPLLGEETTTASLSPEPDAAPNSAPTKTTSPVAQDATHRDYFRSTVELIRQAATALEHAHQCGVIHRDVKPGNLLVDQHRHVWVTDFGLAQIQSDVTLTRTGDVLGTLRYMSPEQAAGDRVVLDHRTDIYSLGVTLYELLTLEPLFHAGNRHALIRQVLEDDPRPPRAINPDIPVELETIVLKAIAKSPGDRYPSAQAMADDLQRWLDDKPIAARRPSLRERAARWSRRHRAAVRAAGVVAALAVLGLIVSTVIIARKHLEISAAHAREIEQRKAAEESFRNARQAVDTFTQLAEDGLADVPSLQLLRRQFLEASLEYYGNFLDQRQDDPALRAELAATAEHVKHLIDELSAVEGYASLALLEDANVLADLDTTATQREQLGRIVSQLSDDRKKLRNSAAALSSDERQRQMAETIHAYELQTNAILSPQQTKRLKELRWQQQAPFVFRHPDVVALLGLTTEQKKKVAQVMDEEMDARAPPHRPGQDHPTGEGRRPGEDLADWGPPETRGRRGEKGGSFFDDRPPPREGMSPRDGPPGREGPPGRDDRPPRQGPFGPDSGPGREGGPGRDGFGGPPPHPFGRADDGRPLAPPGKNAGPPDRHGPGGPGGHNGPGGRSGMCDALKRTTARILELLTPEQRAKWDALIGKPATYDLMREPEGWAPR